MLKTREENIPSSVVVLIVFRFYMVLSCFVLSCHVFSGENMEDWPCNDPPSST